MLGMKRIFCDRNHHQWSSQPANTKWNIKNHAKHLYQTNRNESPQNEEQSFIWRWYLFYWHAFKRRIIWRFRKKRKSILLGFFCLCIFARFYFLAIYFIFTFFAHDFFAFFAHNFLSCDFFACNLLIFLSCFFLYAILCSFYKLLCLWFFAPTFNFSSVYFSSDANLFFL